MERIVLVVPPGLPDTTPNHEGSSGLGAVEAGSNGFRYAPHTVATMAAVLRHQKYEASVVDATACGTDALGAVKAVVDAQPRVIGVFVSWATREGDALFLELLGAARPAGVPIVACGISVRMMHESLQDADYLLEGEPEISFCTVCNALLRANQPLPRVVRSSEVAPVEYNASDLIHDLDALPFPAWDLVPRDKYTHLSILTSRGCPQECAWCPYVIAQGHSIRTCSPDRVIHELREAVTTYQARRIIVRDPAFAHDARRLEQICRRIIGDRVLRPGKRLVWECESRPEYLERRLLRLMALAGCVGIKIGLETTDPELLHSLHRLPTPRFTARYLARVASLARDCANLGIAYRVFAMVGLPGQTLKAAHETAGFVHALRPSALTAKPFKVYPELVLPADAPLPPPEDVEAQEQTLAEAQKAIERENHHAQPRWKLMRARMISRLVSAVKKG